MKLPSRRVALPKKRSIIEVIEDVVGAVRGDRPRRRKPRTRSSVKATPLRRARRPAARKPAARPAPKPSRPKPASTKPKPKPARPKPKPASTKPSRPSSVQPKPSPPKPKPPKPSASKPKPPRPKPTPAGSHAPWLNPARLEVCVSPAEAALVASINEYRGQHGLEPIPVSRGLTLVARLHVRDLALNHPDRGSDARGVPANLHSWSAAGSWRALAYTDDHAHAREMWGKPREITGGDYSANAYELAYESSGRAEPPGVLASWSASPGHSDVLLERGHWQGKRWPALGAGIYGSYAVIWLGELPDPQGEPENCG